MIVGMLIAWILLAAAVVVPVMLAHRTRLRTRPMHPVEPVVLLTPHEQMVAESFRELTPLFERAGLAVEPIGTQQQGWRVRGDGCSTTITPLDRTVVLLVSTATTRPGIDEEPHLTWRALETGALDLSPTRAMTDAESAVARALQGSSIELGQHGVHQVEVEDGQLRLTAGADTFDQLSTYVAKLVSLSEWLVERLTRARPERSAWADVEPFDARPDDDQRDAASGPFL